MLDYEQRERIKAVYRPIIEDKTIPMYLRIHAAEQVMGALFCRSCEAYVKPDCYGDVIGKAVGKGHPGINTYTAMLLKQGHKVLHIPADVYKGLVLKYGTTAGISKGTYYLD